MKTSSQWSETRLSEVMTLQRGHDLPSGQRRPGNVPILGSFGITGWHDTAKVKGPGVTIGRSGGSIGTAVYTDADYWPLNTALYVRDFKGNDPKWVYWLLHSIDFSSFNSGSAQPSLNRNFLSRIPVRRPETDEQRRIADVLSSLDNLIELNRRVSSECDELARTLVTTVPTMVPLSDLAAWSSSPQIKPMGAVDLYSLPAFDLDRLPEQADGFMIKSAKNYLSEPAVLVSRLNPHIPRVWMVYPAPSRQSLASTEFVPITAGPATVEEIYAVTSGAAFCDQMMSHVTGTTGSHQRVDKSVLLTLSVPNVLLLPEAKRSAVRRLVREAASSRADVRELRRTRDDLIPNLLSGKVRVRDLEGTA